jgi:hypothetical protein
MWNKTYCIPPHHRCDMTVDCVDGTDEAQCSKSNFLEHGIYINIVHMQGVRWKVRINYGQEFHYQNGKGGGNKIKIMFEL